MPTGIPYIVVNEGAERFSFYGMKAILVVFMTKHLLGAGGELDVMSEEDAKAWYHMFVTAVYFFPFIGAIVADAFLGKYMTIMSLSIVYCFGHLALALDETRVGLAIGLTLIAIGAGGIKPCVSAHVGDQFGKSNSHLVEKVFYYWYFAINLGALASTLLTEPLLNNFGPHVAFGIPGLLMLMATVVFWMGRHKYAHIPPGGAAFFKETFSKEGVSALLKLAVIYVFIAMFWALFDQTGSAWVLQATRMDRHFIIEWGAAQFQWLNPALVLIFVTAFPKYLYPAVERFVHLTPLRKIGFGMFLTVPAFLLPAWLEARLDAGDTVNIAWQIVCYVIITAAEILISVTALEFSYTQAPKRMKSLIMGAFFLSVSLGNLFTAGVNYFIQNEDGTSKLAGPDYYLFFAGAMLVTAILYVPVAMAYKEKTYIQDEEEAADPGD